MEGDARHEEGKTEVDAADDPGSIEKCLRSYGQGSRRSSEGNFRENRLECEDGKEASDHASEEGRSFRGLIFVL